MIWTLFRYKWKRIMRQPVLFLFLILFPVALIGTFAFVFSHFFDTERENIKLGIIDLDQTFETNMLISQLQNEEQLKESLSLLTFQTEEMAKNEMQLGKISGSILIPDGFSSDLRRGTNTPIQVFLNEKQPFESEVIKLLLNSAAYYISAAQSAINTVNDLYIRDLPDSGTKSAFLNQLIMQYTLFALDRNELFNIENTEFGTSIGWKQHFIIAFFFSSLIISSILFQHVNERKEKRAIEERMRTFHITPLILLGSQWLFYWVFALINTFILLVIFQFVFDVPWLLTKEMYMTFIFVSLLIASFFILFESLISNGTSRMGIGIIVLFLMLFLSGFIVPNLYLPNWVDSLHYLLPFATVYEGIELFILQQSAPIKMWLYVSVVSIIFITIALIIEWLKEGKDAYLSIASK